MGSRPAERRHSESGGGGKLSRGGGDQLAAEDDAHTRWLGIARLHHAVRQRRHACAIHVQRGALPSSKPLAKLETDVQRMSSLTWLVNAFFIVLELHVHANTCTILNILC